MSTALNTAKNSVKEATTFKLETELPSIKDSLTVESTIIFTPLNTKFNENTMVEIYMGLKDSGEVAGYFKYQDHLDLSNQAHLKSLAQELVEQYIPSIENDILDELAEEIEQQGNARIVESGGLIFEIIEI